MVIILYFPISRLMMDDGTGLVINKVSHQSWHTPHCKTRRGSGGSSEFSGSWRWSASECLVIGGGGGGGGRREEEDREGGGGGLSAGTFSEPGPALMGLRHENWRLI